MRKKCAAAILLLLLVMSGALAAYAECSEEANHHVFGAEHEDPAIHCPDVYLNSNIQAPSTIKSRSRERSEVSPGIHEKLDSVVLVARFKARPIWEPYSQQGLFRFEEVFRL